MKHLATSLRFSSLYSILGLFRLSAFQSFSFRKAASYFPVLPYLTHCMTPLRWALRFADLGIRTLGRKGFELAFAPTPEGSKPFLQIRLFLMPLAKSRQMAVCPREPSPRNIWCLAPILGVFVKGGACENRPPRGHRLVSRKEKLRGKSS